MAYLGGTFDASAVEPSTAYEPLPAGEYPVIIVDSNMENTKTGTGQFLKLQIQVIEGEHANAMLFDRLNLVNSNQQAVDIAKRTLSAICHAVGVLQVQDSQQLHNKPMLVKVTVRQGDGQYGPSNDIKAYKPIASAKPAAPAMARPQPAANAAPAPAAAPTGAPPWMAGKAA